MANQDRADLVKCFLEHFRNQNYAEMFAMFTDDVEFTAYGPMPWCGTHKGKEAVRRDLAQCMGTLMTLTGYYIPTVVAGADSDLVFAPFNKSTYAFKTPEGVVDSANTITDVLTSGVYEVKDGKISRVWLSTDTYPYMRALEKAGTAAP